MLNYINDLLMIIAPLIGYVDQYRTISKTKSSDGFSTLISFILVTANILRIFYWFGKRFSIVMLFQSLAMIVCQIIMLYICTKYPSNTSKGNRLSGTIVILC